MNVAARRFQGTVVVVVVVVVQCSPSLSSIYGPFSLGTTLHVVPMTLTLTVKKAWKTQVGRSNTSGMKDGEVGKSIVTKRREGRRGDTPDCHRFHTHACCPLSPLALVVAASTGRVAGCRHCCHVVVHHSPRCHVVAGCSRVMEGSWTTLIRLWCCCVSPQWVGSRNERESLPTECSRTHTYACIHIPIHICPYPSRQ